MSEERKILDPKTPAGAYAIVEELAGKEPLERKAGLAREAALETVRKFMQYAISAAEKEAAENEAAEEEVDLSSVRASIEMFDKKESEGGDDNVE
jgi:hypothetical protein